MHLNVEKSGEQDKERLKEWLVNTGPGLNTIFTKLHNFAIWAYIITSR